MYGRIDPGRFIPLAEETGLIVPIGEWVLRTACAQNVAWREAGLPPIKTAVNLSVRQLKHPGLVERDPGDHRGNRDLTARLPRPRNHRGHPDRQHGAEPAGLGELRAAGVLVSIDDFGTGYSSLSYLYRTAGRHPQNGSPVRACALDSRAQRRAYALAESIVDMAHRLQLNVIAEAVETADSWPTWRRWVVTRRRATYFHRPVGPDQICGNCSRSK